MDGIAQTEGTLGFPFPEAPAEGAATEVAPGILWMRLPLPMALDHVNVYALDDGAAGWTLVDCGIDTKRTRAIWERLMAGPLGGRPVARVIVTHHHPDHIGLAGWFQTEHGAELITSRTAWLFARMLSLDVQARPTPEMLTFWQRAGMAPDVLAERRESRPVNFADALAPMPLGFTRIKEGDRLRAGGRDWIMRAGNGHAPEHVTLWCEDEGLVLAGDQLLATISPNIGVYATEPEADPLTEWLEACRRLGAHATPEQLILPGHKLPFTGLPVRMRQLIENHESALARILSFLETPRTAAECFQPIFRRQIAPGEYGLALVEAVAHLNHLHRLGRVRRDPGPDGAWLWQSVPGPRA